MSEKNDKIGFADVISLIAIVLLAALIFFGINFMSLGNLLYSIVGAILGLILMAVCVFLAAHAKATMLDESAGRTLQGVCVGFYILLLIPTYFFGAKFFNIQFNKEEVMTEFKADVNNMDNLFTEYDRVCESRANAYRIRMQSMMTTPEGRAALAKELKVSTGSLNNRVIDQAASIFLKSLKGSDYQILLSTKDYVVTDARNNFENWNIILVPRYANGLDLLYNEYAESLKKIYEANSRESERNVPAFDPQKPADESSLVNLFTSFFSFSLVGLIVVFILGVLGLFKYLFGVKNNSVAPERGDASRISQNGGFTF